MRVAVEFLRVDAILHQDETDVRDLEVRLLLDLAAQRRVGILAPFDLAAGDAPEIRPLVGANHQDPARVVKNKRAHGGQGHRTGLAGPALRLQMQIVPFQNGPQLAEMFHDQIRMAGAQLFQIVVAGEHRARRDAAMLRGIDVMLHVADEKGFVRRQIIFRENAVDHLFLVHDAQISAFQIFPKTGRLRLHVVMALMNGAEEKQPQPARAAEFQKFAGVRQRHDGILSLAEGAVKPDFQLRHGNVRQMAVVEFLKGQAKLRAELFEGHRLALRLGEDVIRRLPHGGQVIDERARPVENNVADHHRQLNRVWERGKCGQTTIETEGKGTEAD